MTADQAVAIREVVLGFFENEARNTRRVIAAVPDDRRDYRPDEKSRTAWELATHIPMADIWFADSILNGAFVWTGEQPLPVEMSDPASVSRWYERELGARLAKLRALPADHLLRELEFAGLKAPAVSWLLFMNNHSVHHRGQLTSYLRAAGSKVPAVYGVSADENLVDA